MVGYLRTGSLQVKQRFTNDLEKAAKALRPPQGFASAESLQSLCRSDRSAEEV